MPSKLYSCALKGIEAYGVEIEVDILNGLSRFMVVGLPDAAINEAKERVRSALVNSGAKFPHQRKVVNLAPADVRKCGPAFDVAIAIGLLMESGQLTLTESCLDKTIFMGELALDGSVRATEGLLSCALWARANGYKKMVVPALNLEEVLLATELDVVPIKSLKQLILHLQGRAPIPPCRAARAHRVLEAWGERAPILIKGLRASTAALRALAISSAGGHHLVMAGPPGSGKTLLAQLLPSLLPPLDEEEMIELTRIYSAAGLLPAHRSLVSTRPFRSVHHTASAVSLIGGGAGLRPGEISLVHRGVLFLDELLEFPRDLLESLRQPLEDRHIIVARANGTVEFPSHFILAGSMNPCPCGYQGDTKQTCHCSGAAISRYRKRLSGPLLDRIDLILNMQRLTFDQLNGNEDIPLEALYGEILRARLMQKKRFGSSVILNSDLSPAQVQQFCALDSAGEKLLRDSMDHLNLSARGYHRVLKVSRTIADMKGSTEIDYEHLLEALQYRSKLFEPTMAS